ncbi:hypothetical protein MKS88_005615 [Plasmodium brasilianum]|uniref:Uncharacterized protein n=2 Tax=Plasmodium (Plasmodium) TaxID=418103 RepID=A0A1A8WGC1_PLAMA|nr:conserved Plasmodium protein, unknown function [Plasmodium malariae]KAI4834935.1 hypothetical protein MKS88_005615 [Plasmodium brasilianum]SBS90849.1 hypothetical protein PMALA_031090 [Plasmodium malariae]SCP03505.1 conserved Plasmodium protein, unknown function [Plasmodium malariae]
MECSLLNKDEYPFERRVYYDKDYVNYEMPKSKFLHIIIRIGISIISILVVTLFIKSNSNSANKFLMMPINEDTMQLFNSLGFPPNSKELVYTKLEKWGFNLSDIGEEELNENYQEENIKNYKYSKNTYKDILFSYFEKKERSEVEKNLLLYKFLEIIKGKEINTFYEFLNNFMILQDLNCLPRTYKGIYINGNFFIQNHLHELVAADISKLKTLINEQPYLYVTYHGGKKKNSVHNICKFSRDGYYLGSILLPFEEGGKFFNCISLRGLLIHGNNLYVTDSYKDNSKIFQFSSSISELSNRREYISTFISQDAKTNPFMIHPYGIKKNNDYFYISSQNTGTVLRFHIDSGKLGQSINSYKGLSDGLVVKLNNNDEIRGIDFDNLGKCYVSNKQAGVQIYDKDFNLIKIIPVFSPISILFDSTNNHILVGSSKTHDIKEYDVNNFELIKVIKHPLLKHVAGITIYQDSLFVVSQKKNKLLEFSLTTALLKRVLVDDFSDIGERVILSLT